MKVDGEGELLLEVAASEGVFFAAGAVLDDDRLVLVGTQGEMPWVGLIDADGLLEAEHLLSASGPAQPRDVIVLSGGGFLITGKQELDVGEQALIWEATSDLGTDVVLGITPSGDDDEATAAGADGEGFTVGGTYGDDFWIYRGVSLPTSP